MVPVVTLGYSAPITFGDIGDEVAVVLEPGGEEGDGDMRR